MQIFKPQPVVKSDNYKRIKKFFGGREQPMKYDNTKSDKLLFTLSYRKMFIRTARV